MKNLLILIMCLSIHSVGFSQIVNNIDDISPYHEDLAAIRKGNQWAFINRKGEVVIDFRNDLVLNKEEDLLVETGVVSYPYPIFKDGRCLIRKLIDDVYYYGYIDTNGKDIIAPKYLNASNFNNGFALTILLSKEVVGYNEVLKKDITSSRLEEYIIDISGDLHQFLYNPRNYVPSKINKNKPPMFQSKFIAPHLIAVKNKAGTWDIYDY